MIFKELINTVNYNHMWAVLDKEYNHKDGDNGAYKHVKEIESGTSQLISFEKAMAKIGFIDKRTLMEKEKEYREYNRIADMNEKIYKMLLGR